ncbi:hypothetical protein [Nocardioides mangrovicus]|uniref:hypothetical protein n=1 Tax=Nocardioides mangrovicus TaxID=2478913 RepID=UPI0011C3F9D2|nr:hypothetical protein [Nocardioides mangrovicus]
MAVFVLGSILAALRIPVRAWESPWAEDAYEFLHRASTHHGPLGGLAELVHPYAGYAAAYQRVVAWLVTFLPVPSQGVAISLSGALTQAGVAVLAYVTVKAMAGSRAPAAFVAAWVVALPLGQEVVDNLANTAWFLLFGSILVVFWRPRGTTGAVTAALVLAFAALSTPFGVGSVVLAALVWWVTRDAEMRPMVLAGIVAAATQVVVMLTAPARTMGTYPNPPLELLRGWLRRVAGDGVLGVGRYDPEQHVHPDVTVGVLVVLVAALMAALVAWSKGVAAVSLPAVLLAGSLVLFTVTLLPLKVTTVLVPEASRYFVVPALMFLTALALLVSTLHRAPTLSRLLRSGVALAVAGACLFGVLSSWHANDMGRSARPTWQSQVAVARADCANHSARHREVLAVSPVGWRAVFSCRYLTR